MSSPRGRNFWRGRGSAFWMKRNRPTFSPPSAVPPERPQSQESQKFKMETNPYKGWKHFFPDEKYKSKSEVAHRVKTAESYFHRLLTPQLQEEVEERRWLGVAVGDLEVDSGFASLWEDFKEELLEEPTRTLACLNQALHQVVLERSGCEDLPPVRVRLTGLGPPVTLRSLKANSLGRLTLVRGTVIRVGPSKLLASFLAFQCSKCGATNVTPQPEGNHKVPSSCEMCGCRSRSFLPLCSSKLTQTRSCQTIKIQESTAEESDQREGGRVPRTIEVELTDDLVDTCAPGDNVTLAGIVKVRNSEESKKKLGANLYALYLDGVTVENSKNQAARSQGNVGVEFSLKDLYAIQEIHEEAQLFRLLVNSVCAAVYGHEMVKAGLLLGLVGGSVDGRARGMPHVLIVGDPGLGKTHLLHASSSLAPRGVYVCGNTASSSGLTVTLCKESGGDYALEAGALVLANQGVCCIDEFDKMTSQHLALLEAMEQQSVSVAKGGVVCSLPAQTSIIAAANPSGGHYNRAKSLSENLRMSQPLLSRFDLIFVLLDKPNERLDSLLSEHVMALHSGKKGRRNIGGSSSLHSSSSFMDNPISQESPLYERLKLRQGEELDLVPPALLRKYLAYARRYVPCPRLDPGAAAVLQEFYLELRARHQGTTFTPVTTRQLEAMIRLTQARAKIELREEANSSDAKEVVELMRWSLADVCTDERGIVNFKKSTRMGIGTKAKRLIAALETRSGLENKSTFTVSEMKEVSEALGLQVPDFVGFVATLNTQGFLLKKGPNLYKLLSI